jgi:hypothetical protein
MALDDPDRPGKRYMTRAQYSQVPAGAPGLEHAVNHERPIQLHYQLETRVARLCDLKQRLAPGPDVPDPDVRLPPAGRR